MTDRDVEDHTDEELVALKDLTEKQLHHLHNRKGVQEEKYRLQELLRDIVDEQSYRARCTAKGEPYVVPPPPEEDQVPVKESVYVPYSVSVAGKVYDDCIKDNFSDFLTDHPGLEAASKVVKRGKGCSVVFENITRTQVLTLIQHLDLSAYHRLAAATVAEDKEMGYQIRENAQRLKKMVGIDHHIDTGLMDLEKL